MAALTVVKDEAVMLPLWVQHYRERLGLDHLVVLDDRSTDGSTDHIEAEVRDSGGLPGGVDFEKTRLRIANQTATELLERFDWVIFTDADEFLVVDPERHRSLPELLATAELPAVAPMALNVVHDLDAEAPLDPGRPILDQRSYAYFAEIMCKPSSKRRRSPWVLASHGIRTPFEIRRDLFMLHLKFADRDRLRVSTAHRRALNVSDGRGGGSWKVDGVPEKFEARMRSVDFAATEEFDPAAIDLDSLTMQTPSGRAWRTAKFPQLLGLDVRPIVRIPTRLRGSL